MILIGGVKMKNLWKIVLCIGIAMIIVSIAIQVIGMLIDHECYQLEPNEFYQNSICERYWGDR